MITALAVNSELNSEPSTAPIIVPVLFEGCTLSVAETPVVGAETLVVGVETLVVGVIVVLVVLSRLWMRLLISSRKYVHSV